jgi:hypothetical protein
MDGIRHAPFGLYYKQQAKGAAQLQAMPYTDRGYLCRLPLLLVY